MQDGSRHGLTTHRMRCVPMNACSERAQAELCLKSAQAGGFWQLQAIGQEVRVTGDGEVMRR